VMSMWRATVGVKPPIAKKPVDDDEWETDPDFVNDISEKESRWGAKTVVGSGHQAHISLSELRNEALKADQVHQEKKLNEMPRASEGYGGQFGVQKDRVDKCAAGWDEKSELSKHQSQKDYSVGFGGQYGVQKDRQDKSAAGWDEKTELSKHDSQVDYKKGWGGQFGIQADRKDKSAVGWDEKAELAKHESQTDYKKGWGGQYGIQSDRQDKSAVGFEYHEGLHQHESQKLNKGINPSDDQSRGEAEASKPFVRKSPPEVTSKGNASSLKARFEQGAGDAESKIAAERERRAREDVEQREREMKAKNTAAFEPPEPLAKHPSQMANRAVVNRADDQTRNVEPILKPSIGTKAPQIATEKGHASDLKKRFEQMAVADEGQNRVMAERERRKREDEELKEQQRKAEEERQRRMEAEWNENEANRQQTDPDEEARRHEQQWQAQQNNPVHNQTRRSGPVAGAVAIMPGVVSQPKATSPVAAPTIESLPQYEEPPMDVPPPAPVAVLPSAAPTAPAVLACSLRRKPSSDDEVDNDAEWEEEEKDMKAAVSAFKAAISPVKVETSAPAPAKAAPVQDQYDVVPGEEEPTSVASDPLHAPANPLSGSGPTGLTAVAIYDYQKQDNDEISFEPNDIITNIEQIDAGWWRGTCNGQRGLFPANYVELR
ncbi:hypothetical protein WR25_11836, partial [Diploscapter pachys]